MRNALKLFIFVKKNRCVKVNFLFKSKWKIFTYCDFIDNIVYLKFKFVLNKNQSGWWTTSHSA